MPAFPPIHPNRIPILNHYAAFRRQPLQFWIDCGKVAPVVQVQFGPKLNYWVVTDPDFLQHILQTNVKNYPRERRLMSFSRKTGPELLFNTDKWDEWLWRRRLMQPAFHRKQIVTFADAMVDETTSLISGWQDGGALDIQHAMKTLTMRIIGRTMFSADVGEDTNTLQRSFEQTTKITYQQTQSMFTPPKWFSILRHARGLYAGWQMIQILQRIVHQRYETNAQHGDLLDMLIAAQLDDDDGTSTEKIFSAEQLVYEMAGVVFAGHETTALTLTWLFYLLATHPTVAAKIYAELDAVVGDDVPSLEHTQHLPLLTQLIHETLRLYPPVYVTIREADADDAFGDYHIPKGTSLVLNIRGLHLSETYWDDPLAFDLGRFSAERTQNRHAHAYMPFIYGPKKCIGDAFAMLELQLVTATILQRYHFYYANTQSPKEQPGFVMEAQNGIELVAAKRNKS